MVPHELEYAVSVHKENHCFSRLRCACEIARHDFQWFLAIILCWSWHVVFSISGLPLFLANLRLPVFLLLYCMQYIPPYDLLKAHEILVFKDCDVLSSWLVIIPFLADGTSEPFVVGFGLNRNLVHHSFRICQRPIQHHVYSINFVPFVIQNLFSVHIHSLHVSHK